jgi:tetratricopeptide (TPR) repeat protein
MSTDNKKLSKKEIKEDTLVTAYYKFIGYFSENQKPLLIAAGVFVVLVAAIFLYKSHQSANNELANVELSRVMNVYDAGVYPEAISGRRGTNVIGLQKIVDEYGSTKNGEIAKVYLANSYFMLGKFDLALKYYKDYSGSNDTFEATALAGQASCYEALNDNEKAADLYKKAASVSESNVLNPDYLLKAGIDYMQLGKKSDAKELFEKIKKDYSTSASFREVDRYLSQLL